MQPSHQGGLQLTLVASRALSLAARIAGKAGFAGFLSAFLLGFFGAGCTVFLDLKQSLHPALEILLRLRAFVVFRCFHCSYTLHTKLPLLKLRVMYGALLGFILGLLTRTKSNGLKRAEHDCEATEDHKGDNQSIVPPRVQISFSDEDKKEYRTYQEILGVLRLRARGSGFGKGVAALRSLLSESQSLSSVNAPSWCSGADPSASRKPCQNTLLLAWPVSGWRVVGG